MEAVTLNGGKFYRLYSSNKQVYHVIMIYDVYCCFLVDHKLSRLTASKCSFAFLRLLHEMKRREGLQSTPGLVYIYIQDVPLKCVIYVLGYFNI